MATKKELNRPVDPKWVRVYERIGMGWILIPGFDRPTFANWMACALRDAYEQGLAGQEYDEASACDPKLGLPPHPDAPVETLTASAPKRRTRPAPEVVEAKPAVRVMRRRT